MGLTSGYSPEEMQAVKSYLVATKVLEIAYPEQFHTQYMRIWTTLVSQGAIDHETVLAMDTLAVCLNRILAMAKQDKACVLLYTDPLLLEMFRYVCDYHQHGSGAYTNAVGGLLTKLLQLMNYVATQSSLEITEGMFWQVKVCLMSMQPSQKSFYVIAEAALKHLDGFARALHVSDTRLPNQCLEIMWSGALANSAAKTFCAYYSQLHDPRKEPVTYIQSWSVNVEEKLSHPALRANIIDHLLPHLFKAIPNLFWDWAKRLHCQSMSADWQKLLLDILKKGLQISPSIDPVSSGLVDSKQLGALLNSPDDKIMLDSFALAANAINASKCCPEYALRIIQDSELLNSFFKESTTPESRCAFMSVFRKALLNMKDYVTTTEMRMRKNPCTEAQSTVLKYTSALQSIFSFVCAQLIPDSSYAQTVASLDLVKLFTEHAFDGIPRKKMQRTPVRILDIFTPMFTNTLLRFTTNNYDDIRLQASLILFDCPYEVFKEVINIEALKQTSTTLQSFKGRESDSVAQLLVTVFSAHQHNNEENCISFLQMILHTMESVMNFKPLEMHGYFIVWARILPVAILTEQKKLLFKCVIEKLLKSIEDIWITMKPHMRLSKSSKGDDTDSNYWRVIKESANLLKSIMCFNMKSDGDIFDIDRMPGICQMLIDQLTTMTHRGAFASISAAFVTACEICFKIESLSAYPHVIVAQTLGQLTSQKQLITRRSAGIPFVLCGVISAASRCNKVLLKQLLDEVFSRLHEIATLDFQYTGNETHDTPQIHAFNCIRQLFKETSIDDGTKKHANQALILSLTYLNDQTWSVKNSSLMLFTALNEKLFGSHKLGDTLPSVNASLFFSQYPGISEILLSLLESSDQKNVNSIVPVLAIVCRLKVNSKDDSTLDPFIDLLKERYLCHRVWKVREMSARLIANMVHKTSYSSELLESLKNTRILSRNKQHGCLLYAKELIEQAQYTKTDLEDYTSLAASSFYEACMSRHDGDVIIQRACLQVMMTEAIPQKDAEKIGDYVIQIVKGQWPQPDGAVSLFLGTAVSAVLRNISEEKLVETSKMYLSCHRYEVQVATCKHFMVHHEQFAKLEVLHPYLMQEISARSGDYVTGLYLDLALKLDIRATRAFKKPQCGGEKETLTYHLLALRLQQDSLSMIGPCAPEASVDVKLIHARIVAERMSLNPSEVDEVKLILQRLQALSDDSRDVRVISCFSGLSIRNSKKSLLQRAGSLAKVAAPYFSQEIKRSVMQNLDDFEDERASTDRDYERSNTFANEVQDTQDLLQVIKSSLPGALADRVLLNCVETVLQIAKENAAILQCYAFNVHLDTAVRKALLIAQCHGHDENARKAVQEFSGIFQAVNYPIQVVDPAGA